MPAMSFATAKHLLTSCGAVLVDTTQLGMVIDQGDAVTITWHDFSMQPCFATFTADTVCEGDSEEVRLRHGDLDVTIWLMATVDAAMHCAAA